MMIFAPHYEPAFKAGGVVTTLVNLIATLADRVSFVVFTSDRDLGEQSPYSNIELNTLVKRDNAEVYYSNGWIGYFHGMKVAMSRLSEYDYVYINGLFSTKYSIIPTILIKLFFKDIKLLVGMRGEASSKALSKSKFKKKLLLGFFKLSKLHINSLCQATSNFEVDEIKSNLPLSFKDVIIVEDAVKLPVTAFESKRRFFGTTKIIFVGRVAPIKNLKFALTTLMKIDHKVVFDIFGFIEDKEYWEHCSALITQLPKNITVNYKGVISNDLLIAELSKYDLLFLPSKSENFGHVIFESLACGVPVLISDRTPWRELEIAGVGWDLSLESPKLYAQKINEFCSFTAHERNIMRLNASSFANNKFSNISTQESLKLFSW